ncbi:MAG: sodium:proton antiporter [Rhizobiaceae bacterium]
MPEHAPIFIEATCRNIRARTARFLSIVALITFSSLAPAFAAEGAELPGNIMSLWWALPFAGILLSIATGPVLYPHFWEHRYGKITLGWTILVLFPMLAAYGLDVTLTSVLHTVLLEYLPFIILLFALFTIAGGILVRGNIHGTPLANVGLLAIGSVLASLVGTTGASMIMVRPVIRANDNRRFNAHVIVFFIFLVSNIGGSLTPLGDPPLFVGFLRGVDFFWTTEHLLLETLFVAGIVIAAFFVLDVYLHLKEDGAPKIKDPTPDSRITIRGVPNFLLLAGVIGAILMSASWKPGVSISIHGVHVEAQNLLRDIIILALAGISLKTTRAEYRKGNDFSWGPILEVAKLFAGIFIAIIPVIAILKAGSAGALASLVTLVTSPDGGPNNLAYFWLTGGLSSFLDNAPTYLVFFELAGGDPQHLMGPMALTLTAISCGAVFMGANTYIGNAPNFMVYAIARQGGVKMPSFFGYMLWSSAVLVPVYVVTGWLFFG